MLPCSASCCVTSLWLFSGLFARLSRSASSLILQLCFAYSPHGSGVLGIFSPLSLFFFSSLPYVTLQHLWPTFQMRLVATLRPVSALGSFSYGCFSFTFPLRPSLAASWTVCFVICGSYLFGATIEQLFHDHWGSYHLGLLTGPHGCWILFFTLRAS